MSDPEHGWHDASPIRKVITIIGSAILIIGGGMWIARSYPHSIYLLRNWQQHLVPTARRRSVIPPVIRIHPQPTPSRTSQPTTPGNATPAGVQTVARAWAMAYLTHPDGSTPQGLARAVAPYSTAGEVTNILQAMMVPQGLAVTSLQIYPVIPALHPGERSYEAVASVQGPPGTVDLWFSLAQTSAGWRVAQEDTPP